MKILDVLTSPWAIQPEKLLELQGIYATHLRGEKIDIEAVEKKLGRPLANDRQSYQIQDGVAIIQMNGVIAKRMNLFAQISGGASSEIIGNDIRAAVNDSAVHSIILNIDSPGGTVDGTQALAQIIMSARDQKTIVTLADGVMASAAYWIGSAASKVYITGDTTAIGSIGVVISHQDVSRAEAQAGVKTTEIYAGKYKRVASSYEPLNQDGKDVLQAQVDYLYSIFVANVAEQRGVSVETVLSDMADARIFFGQQAIDAGLVDGVFTLEALVAELNTHRGGVPQTLNLLTGGSAMLTKDQIMAEAPTLAADFRAEGAQAERDRIASVRAQAMPGHEALIEQLASDGKTTGPEAAVQILAAEKVLKQTALANISAEAVNPVTFLAAADDAAQDETLENLPLEEKAKANWDKTPALRAEFGDNFKAYLGYQKAVDSGRVKTVGSKKD